MYGGEGEAVRAREGAAKEKSWRGKEGEREGERQKSLILCAQHISH